MPLRRREFAVALSAAALRAGSPPTAGPILEALAARYAALTRFTLAITRWQESASLHSGTARKRTMHLTCLDATHFRYEDEGTILVSDGSSLWHYRAEGRAYLHEPVGLPGSRIQAEFSRLHTQFVGRFRQLPQLASLTQAKGDQPVPGTKLVRPLLEIAPRNGDWLERLWLDPGESLVFQSAFSRALTTRGRDWLFHRFQFQQRADGAAFRFTPPAKARQVERFSSPPVIGDPLPL